MLQFMHCCMLLYIVFVIAEIRNVLVHSDPTQAAPLTIWEEKIQHTPENSRYNVSHSP